nr:psb30 [Halimeda opuntia]UTN43189.1 psb30 [Halimeda opuntia]
MIYCCYYRTSNYFSISF